MNSAVSDKINVLIANPFAAGISGNDEVLLRVLANISMDKFHFVIVQPGENPYAERYKQLGAEVHFIKMSIIKRNLKPGFVFDYAFGFLPTVYRIVNLCREKKINIVHTNTTQILGAGLAAKILGLPSIYHAHSILLSPQWVVDGMAKWVKLTGDILLSNSKMGASSFINNGFDERKVRIIGNPVDPISREKYSAKGRFRAESGIGENIPVVGIAGRITPNKKIEQFIRAAKILSARFPNAKFVVIGGANTDEETLYWRGLEKIVAEYGIADRIIFTGRRTDVDAIMQDIDILAHAHTNEGFGLVIAEAMMAGVPVVAPKAGGIPELVIDGETGLLIPPDNPEAMAEAIAELLDNPQNAVKFGRAGRDRAYNLFRTELVAKSIADVYLQMSENKSGKGSI